MRIKFTVALTLLGVAVAALAPMTASAADQAVRVPLDVEVYGKPTDESTKRSEDLKAGSKVLLLKQRADHWCNVASGTDPVPGGKGWIWCGQGGDNQDYSVQPVVAEAPAGGGGTGPGEATEAPKAFQCIAEVSQPANPAGATPTAIPFQAADVTIAEAMYRSAIQAQGLVILPDKQVICTALN